MGSEEEAYIYTWNRYFTVFFGLVFLTFITLSAAFLFCPNCGKYYNNIHERIYYNRTWTGSLYRDIMYHKTECLFTPVFFIVKRLVFVYCSFYISDTALAIAIFNIVIFASLLHLVATKPFQETWM